MEAITRKAGAAAISKTPQKPEGAQKSSPSKFDLLRADLNRKLPGAQLPAPVTTISEQQKKMLESDLRKKLEGAKSPAEVFGGDMKQLRSGLADLNRQVAAIPETSAFAPLRERLNSIEAQFNASANLIGDVGAIDNPKRLLEMQMEVYKLSQNVEILSRTINEVASGIKQVLQTQV